VTAVAKKTYGVPRQVSSPLGCYGQSVILMRGYMSGYEIISSFPLTTRQVFQKYTRLPPEASRTFYHYTTHDGLEGILRSGGLRATYRKLMNDTGEFEYARSVVFKALDEVQKRHDLPSVALSITEYTLLNLKNMLEDTTDVSSSFCACFTVSPDHAEQWQTYAENGNGFAIGFDIPLLLKYQKDFTKAGLEYIYCLPVLYNKKDQIDIVHRLVESGIQDLKRFADNVSQQSEYLTSLRDEITKEIVTCLLVLIDFIKSERYASEKEIRFILDANDANLAPSKVEYYKRGDKTIPFVFLNLCSPDTKRLPLAEIKVGPNASFAQEKRYVEGMLNELGYGLDFDDDPSISKSLF